MVRELWPDFRDQQGPVSVQVIGRMHPQDQPGATAAGTMSPGDAKVDLLVTGRLFKVRFSGAGGPTACRIGQPMFDVATTGRL
jgi:hypothetical protein